MNISEIAKLAGVSPASVSRYLNNGYLSQEKRERIAKVIKETGYTPSSQAQMLRTRKTKLIGVIIPKIDSSSISQVVAGISSVLAEKGYQMLLANTENNTAKELDYIHIFAQNMVDGLILLGTELTHKHRQLLKEIPLPVIILGQHTADFSCVYHDDYGAACTITQALLDKGYRDIAFLGVTPKDKAVGQDRLQGFLDTMQKAGLTVSDNRLTVGSFSVENGYNGASKQINETACPDAILCATDTIAFGAMKALQEKGYRIPEDIALAGFGDSAPSSILTPSLTTIHFLYRESGIDGAKALFERIDNPNASLHAQKLGSSLILRESI